MGLFYVTINNIGNTTPIATSAAQRRMLYRVGLSIIKYNKKALQIARAYRLPQGNLT